MAQRTPEVGRSAQPLATVKFQDCPLRCTREEGPGSSVWPLFSCTLEVALNALEFAPPSGRTPKLSEERPMAFEQPGLQIPPGVVAQGVLVCALSVADPSIDLELWLDFDNAKSRTA